MWNDLLLRKSFRGIFWLQLQGKIRTNIETIKIKELRWNWNTVLNYKQKYIWKKYNGIDSMNTAAIQDVKLYTRTY
jgi:hypothetical protein